MLSSKRSWPIFITALFLFALILTGCGLAPASTKDHNLVSSTPIDGGTFRFGMISSPSSLEPAFLEEINGIEIGKELYDGLVRYDPKTLEIKPAIAETWDYSQDDKVITFHLRKNVKFHDGTSVKAQDVIDDWNRLAAKDILSPVAFPLKPIVGFAEVNSGEADTLSGLKKIDDYTLEVTLNEKNAAFLTSLGHPSMGIYKIECAEKAGRDFGTPAASPETLIGTGAFKFVKWKSDQEIVIEKFNDYYGVKPHVDNVVYKLYNDESTALNDFRAGNLDYVDMVPPGQRQFVLKNYPNQTINTETLSTQFIGFNLNKEPFKDDVNLRKAIAYALDPQSIVDTILEGASSVSNGPLPSAMPGYDKDLKAPTFDKEKAKDYLIKAGYPDGKGLPPIQYAYNYNVENQKIAEAFQAQLKDVGIQIELKSMEWGSYINALQSGENQMFRVSWVADYPDPDNFLGVLYSKSQWGMNNVIFYSNPEVEKLLAQGLEETDLLKRMDIYKQVQEKLVEDQPALWTFTNSYLRLFGKNVHDLTVSALDQKDMRSVWLSKK
ncbi:ABC-type dipeptide transport system, periplasmic component [Desulfosporosinus orientis DSM 765]|uniref:ABC-type dipeptide transport system, periplasmic component n=1 Tax=Desulfosporosinus orientis (strain ATCC 19365 / DSM 765 / NCIMB 8382 / VKM B-1628 / Singapore I) TaxID=768706 RepID=G7WDW6_DESOD|nr:ABC transporter substrate-binding protein [Desulfosporosinus orientis]AET68873.1 ABC-type dipeptide transport system, periplasmic component [Desulfosporosinus orientis DSM 765]